MRAADPPKKAYKGLDFKDFKVVDEQRIPGQASTGSLELVNEGKYEVSFRFIMKSKLMKSILKLEPNEGVLPPAENGVPRRTKIEAIFKAEEELTLARQYGRALTHHRAADRRGLCHDAGPRHRALRLLQVPDGPARHQLRTDGLRHHEGAHVRADRTLESSNSTSHSSSRARREPANGPELKLGRFTVVPQNGTIPSKGTATLTVKFAASRRRAPSREILIIDVADRDVNKEPEGVLYELQAESCIPGIETTDFVQIFEEQTVNRTVVLAAAGLPSNVFAEDEKLFTFGSHMVGQEVSERFKLTNPFKVPCTVNLGVAGARAQRAAARMRRRRRRCPSTSSRRRL